ncbi:helix-turn-helix domain-containing protein [Amycolatopsis sp. BJA-103]|uniref:winged helix-turn-helix transcriptional regulator n=1 Tax=Amycolatopsis sp. BJA-103 TaxID=1911175 RepID=UPI000C76525B|nr:helix-turn-helix domain-containing protein [Amycolatopsis sp. BJA-103]AUI58834.1 transcriptional regulator [Amycolatopsis sp. BJA-103]PNE17715.1 transcriptional regulator [Amycolatopsis sp. BJA-103]
MTEGPRDCSIANAMEVIGERWSLLALREVFFGARRFDQIVRNTGASRDILTARLRKLVEAGILEKRLYEEHPPRYEYVLTKAGHALNHVLLNLMAWGDEYVTDGPPPTVWRHSCGEDLAPETVCAHCREPVREKDMALVRSSRRVRGS